jgi:hypothetical protein
MEKEYTKCSANDSVKCNNLGPRTGCAEEKHRILRVPFGEPMDFIRYR